MVYGMTLEKVLYILTTISCLTAEQLSDYQIQILKSRTIVTTFNENFHVSNVTFACNQTINSTTKVMINQLLEREDWVSIRRVSQLNKEDMRNLLRYKGGTFIPEYLASDKETARKTFPDAKILRFKWHLSVAGGIAKLSKKLNNLNKLGLPLKQSAGKPPLPKALPVQSRYSGRRAGTALKLLGPPNILALSGAGSSRTNSNHTLEINIQKGTSTLSRRKQNAQQQEQGSINHKLFGRRKRRQAADDTIVRIDESCSEAGEPSEFDQNYLHLCKICSAKRLLPENRYPPIINEVFCKPSEDGCLGDGNGKCAPTIFNVHILKRKDNVCRLCVKDSEALAVNEWEIYIEPISVGCECMLNKNSDYKKHWFTSAPRSNQTPSKFDFIG